MAEINLDGMEEFQDMLEEMTVLERDERAAIRKSIKVIAEQVEHETPRGRTGKLAEMSTRTKKDGFGVIGEVKAGAYWDVFQEFGTSYQKANVGYFERAVAEVEDEAINVLVNELLKKMK